MSSNLEDAPGRPDSPTGGDTGVNLGRKALNSSLSFCRSALTCWLLPTVVLALCLFGPAQSLQNYGTAGAWLRETTLTFRDSETQWMVFVCLAVYFVTFMLLSTRQGTAPLTPSLPTNLPLSRPVATLSPALSGGEGRERGRSVVQGFNARKVFRGILSPSAGERVASSRERGIFNAGRLCSFSNADLWLAVGLLIGAFAYAFNYSTASKSTEALMLLGGVVLGKGAAVWAQWGRGKAESGKRKTEISRATTMEDRKIGVAVGILLVLLVAAVFLRNETGMQFQYRGQVRWTGPWDNPNIFGMLMGVGLVLGIGHFLSLVTRHSSRGQVRSRWSVVSSWSKLIFFLAAAGVLSFGLLKSYSRGAWLATVCGMIFLAIQSLRNFSFQFSAFRFWLRRNWMPLATIFVSVLTIAFWNYRHTERVVARRAFSVGNVNDFSWRNRVAAYEGALQMIGDKPWFGFGWHQPERVYDQYYRPFKVTESAAIQLNDPFMLGMTLGIPALVCFVAYIGMALATNAKGQRLNAKTSASSLLPSAFSLPSACCAGALVLVVGFCFDGGLFKLATASVFWILLGLGAAEGSRSRTGALKAKA